MDWPTGFQVPAVWPKELTLRWKVEVGSGHSSPVVAGGQVFVFSRQGDRETVRRNPLSDARQAWSGRATLPRLNLRSYAEAHGQGPKSTPVVFDGRLYSCIEKHLDNDSSVKGRNL